MFPEYLVNFDYMERIMENYGFKLLTRDEAKEHGLPNGTGMFNELFVLMEEEVKRNRLKQNEYGDALSMNSYEKKISFLNRYFIYKKIATVNAEKISIELIEEGVDEKRKSKTRSSKKSSSLSASSSSQMSSSSNKKTKASKATEKTYETKTKSKKNVTSKITNSKPKIRKLNKVLILDDTAETIQSEPVTNLNLENELEKSVIEKEMTFIPETTRGEKEKIQIDETSMVDQSAFPIETLQKEEEPEMITIENTEANPSKTKESKKSAIKKKKVKLLIEE
jgi:hypothetical protein